MKKLCILLALLMVFGLCAVSCGGVATVDNAIVAYDGSEVTITFYHTMGANLREVLDEYIEEFNKLYPNIKVEHSQEGGYDDVRDKIKNEITVGNQPNLAYCYPDHVAVYNDALAVKTLDDFISSTETVTRADGTTEQMGFTDAQIADFIEGYYNEGKAFGDGKMYTLPFSKSTEVLYYNKTFFEQNNLSVPTTWDELYEVCKKIKEIAPKSIPLGYDSEANWFITMCEQYGSSYTSATGEHFLFDNDQNKDFAKVFNKWFSEGLITTQTLYGAYTSGMFVEQKSYMSIGSSAGATHQRPTSENGKYPFEVGIASIPQVDSAKPKVISQGPSVCIFKNDDPQKEAASWLLLKFLTTSVGFQADFARASGYMPVIKSVNNDEVFKRFIESADGGDYIAALSMKVSLEQQNAYFVSPAFVGSSVARDEVGALLTKCLLMTGTADEIKAQLDEAFAAAVKKCKQLS